MERIKLSRRICWLMIGMLGLPIVGDAAFKEEFFTVKAAAFTPSVIDQVVSDETVSDGTQSVYENGVTEKVVVNHNGAQEIYESGVANDTIINSGGIQRLYTGGTTNDTIVNENGQQFIAAGGEANSTIINEYGQQFVEEGGTANDTVVNNYGQQFVGDGGIANGTLVDYGGFQDVEGKANSTTVRNGGNQHIGDSGIANDTTVTNYGNQYIGKGGIANDTTVSDYGEQTVSIHGTANDTIVNSRGHQSIDGIANDAIINAGGSQNVAAGGIANNTLVNADGLQRVFGTANDTILDGGTQTLEGGIANNTIVNDGGRQIVDAGSTANDTTVYTGGAIFIRENGTQLTGTTTLDGGSIYLTPVSNSGSSFFITSDIENIVGDGSIYLNTNLEALTGDLIRISGSISGEQQVFANNQGGASVDKDQTLTIIETAGGGNFSLGQQVEVGGYLYDLRKNPGNQNNWELYSPGNHTSSGSASINAFAGSYLLNYAETQTLLQRMGDLRQGENQGGVWARALGGKFESNGSSFLSGFDMNYSGLQVGSDKKISLKNGKGDLYVGGMFGYSKGNLDYGVGSGSIDSKTLGAYGTYIAPNGFYADLALKYGWMKNDFKVLDTAGNRVTGEDMNTDGLSASLEVGQKIHFNKTAKEGWYVEPQAQISMGHQSGGSFHASNGLRVDVDSYTSTLGRLGINAGYEVKSGKNPVNVYAKASYVHEFDGDVGYRMNGIAEQTSFGDSWWTYGVGITAQINKKHNVYLDIERASGGQFSQPWSLNGGYRFSW